MSARTALRTAVRSSRARQRRAPPPHRALPAFLLIKGPKRLYLVDFGHQPATNPPSEFDYAAVEVRAWFDRFLKGIPNGIDKRPPVEVAPVPWRMPGFFKLVRTPCPL